MFGCHLLPDTEVLCEQWSKLAWVDVHNTNIFDNNKVNDWNRSEEVWVWLGFGRLELTSDT